MSKFRDAVNCERPAPVADILLPNGTVAATTDYDVSASLTREAVEQWRSFMASAVAA